MTTSVYDKARADLDAAEALFESASAAHKAAMKSGDETTYLMLDSAYALQELTRCQRAYDNVVDASADKINEAFKGIRSDVQEIFLGKTPGGDHFAAFIKDKTEKPYRYSLIQQGKPIIRGQVNSYNRLDVLLAGIRLQTGLPRDENLAGTITITMSEVK